MTKAEAGVSRVKWKQGSLSGLVSYQSVIIPTRNWNDTKPGM